MQRLVRALALSGKPERSGLDSEIDSLSCAVFTNWDGRSLPATFA